MPRGKCPIELLARGRGTARQGLQRLMDGQDVGFDSRSGSNPERIERGLQLLGAAAGPLLGGSDGIQRPGRGLTVRAQMRDIVRQAVETRPGGLGTPAGRLRGRADRIDAGAGRSRPGAGLGRFRAQVVNRSG
ncbi:hypothetical protein [Candidatus Accumulibacter contiguus]|uniref:hypothetical protein n=1 Tax=Candidatus Accumulibacter contiguus TaxID=2954381 RepID=UPI00145CD872|nr:hypothetical protein [Candidatus Accumulibacter contiguus]